QREDERRRTAALMVDHELLRKDMARSLHDDLGAEASSALFRARRIQEHFDSGELSVLVRELEAVVAGIRNAAYSLHPVSLDDLGLCEATIQLTRQLSENSPISFQAHVDRAIQAHLNPEMEALLYSVTRESLSNVIKHSSATTASVFLTALKGRVRLVIEDDGIGFFGQHRGIGLSSIEERVRLVGGELELGKSLSGGAALTVTLVGERR
ncbi:MAG: ATP-binding protein, partial [Myxococcota bacterium]